MLPCEDLRVPELGKFLVVLGAVIVVLGLLLWSGVGSGWLGRLPGDIRIERGNSTFYFPIVTCIIISIVLSLVFSLFRR
jgi:ribose/xylose/arabinose/galactoside ABC-type transport system permease subunit